MPDPQVLLFDTKGQLDTYCADLVSECASRKIASKGRFALVLSGGTTPASTYRRLSSSPYKEMIDWSRTFLFFSDERFVPPDHPDSNYRMVRESLLGGVPIPPGNIIRIKGELPPERAARQYEKEIIQKLGKTDGGFDMVLLGMGADGHTASLFPGNPAVKEVDRLAVGVSVDSRIRSRVSLTLQAINRSQLVAFLVTGSEKSERVRQILKKEPGGDMLPAAMVNPDSGQLFWLLDMQAGSLLKSI